ncbi:class I SAM-dependent methyltransferase [Pontibacter sp. H249]|uniref:class I SAM-dependent methyltransferase n=1 Tax=Pontibacter sp. H249 TaxID=3133420 RepID=UPI0030C4BEA5
MPKHPDSGFDRVAPFYDKLAKLIYGDALQKAQLFLLPFIPERSKVLVIGGGSGWLLEQLILTGKQLDILYVDAAPGMLERAKQRYKGITQPHSCQVTFRLGTEATLQPHEQFDTVITPFLLDLFLPQRLQQLMQKLTAALTPAGNWLFADFWPIKQPTPYWQKFLTWSMYTFFDAVSSVESSKLPDYGRHFQELGFKETSSQSFYNGFVQAKVFMRK